MVLVMPVMWFWVLVAADAAITLIIFSVFTRPAMYEYHHFFNQHICSRGWSSRCFVRTSMGCVSRATTQQNDVKQAVISRF
jgi:hypothetical protein